MTRRENLRILEAWPGDPSRTKDAETVAGAIAYDSPCHNETQPCDVRSNIIPYGPDWIFNLCVDWCCCQEPMKVMHLQSRHRYELYFNIRSQTFVPKLQNSGYESLIEPCLHLLPLENKSEHVVCRQNGLLEF